MGLFKKFINNRIEIISNESVNIFPYNLDKSSWFEVYSACLGKMTAIKSRCDEEITNGKKWYADLKHGIIKFGKEKFPLQFIGSEGNASN